MKKYRVWAEVELDQIKANVRTIRSHLSDEAEVLVVVKADGYGHGDVPVARASLEAGAEMVGVGDSTEAIGLREAGIRAPILILGAMIEEEIGWVVSYEIQPTLHSMEMVRRVETEARQQNKQLPVHVMVNTGMVRLGASPESAIKMAVAVDKADHLKLEGISTHLSCSYGGQREDESITRKQVRKFEQFLDQCRRKKISFRYAHLSNSGGVFRHQEGPGNMVRPGISVYGVQPGSLHSRELELSPVLGLHSQITFLRGVRAGTAVGYDHTYTVKDDTNIATVPVGYHDGYPHRLSNSAEVLVRGKRCPVVGKVSMDYTMIDVGHLDQPKVGERVTLIGEQGDDEITAVELAEWADTIPYEILCTLGKRVKRIYY